MYMLVNSAQFLVDIEINRTLAKVGPLEKLSLSGWFDDLNAWHNDCFKESFWNSCIKKSQSNKF